MSDYGKNYNKSKKLRINDKYARETFSYSKFKVLKCVMNLKRLNVVSIELNNTKDNRNIFTMIWGSQSCFVCINWVS